MKTYTALFPFPKQSQPLSAGDVVTLSDQQAQWYLPDGRIVPATGSITGLVFNDTNQDGVHNGGESGFSQALTLRLTDAEGTVHTETTSNDTYQFDNLPVGEASLEIEAIPPGYQASTALPVSVTVVANQSVSAPDIGLYTTVAG